MAVSFFAGWGIAAGTHLVWIGTLALVLLSLTILYLSLSPNALFLGWLLIAPLLQESARETRIGRILYMLFYALPIGVFMLHAVQSNTLTRRARWYDTLPLAYLLFIILSKAVVDSSGLKTGSFYTNLVHSGVLIGVPLYYFCAFGPLDRLSPRRVSVVLFSCTSVVGAMGIAEHYAGWNLWGQDSVGNPPRIVSTLSQPGILGAFLGAGIVLATTVLVWGGPTSLRRPAVATLAVTIPALFFTYTRGGILASTVVASLLIASKPRIRLLGAGIVVLLGVFISANWGAISDTSLYQRRATDTLNVHSRVLLARASLHLAAQRPLVGWGYGTFDTVKNAESFNTGNLAPGELYDYTSHNTYLTILVELGSLGLLVFLLPFVIVGIGTLRILRSAQDRDWFTLALLGILAVIGLTALTTDMRFFSLVPALAWIVVGLLRRRLPMSARFAQEASPA